MHVTTGPLAGLLVGTIALLAPGAAAQDGEYTAELKYKVSRTWRVILPAETWSSADGIAIPHADGSGFAARKDGLSLSIDTNGDGKLDHRVKGAGGYAVLTGKRKDGSSLTYAVRIRLSGKAYEFATSGSMVGSVYNVPVQVIDQNNNGVYNEYGVDAMVVGKSNAASYLSKIVNLKGQLYHFGVTADGREVQVRPYDGESGTLSLRKGLNIPGQLESAVVSEADRAISFQVADSASGLLVPVGSYTFTGGYAVKGGDSARLRAGKMKPVEVLPDAVSALKWGAPLVAEFDYTRDGGSITVQPKVAFLGQAGEEWHTLLPDAKSPKLAFLDKDTQKLLATKRFEGC